MKIYLFLILLMLIYQDISSAQITRQGVNARNAGSSIGFANTVNCDGNCIICTMSGSVMNITFSSSCGSSSPQFLLLEDGSFLLLEDGSKLIL